MQAGPLRPAPLAECIDAFLEVLRGTLPRVHLDGLFQFLVETPLGMRSQQPLHFENSQCTKCGHALAFVPEHATLTAIEAVGASLLFIPPYSPDLNPIEQAIGKLKTLLRAKAIRTVDALWKALGGVADWFTPEECANYLRHAGYFQSP